MSLKKSYQLSKEIRQTIIETAHGAGNQGVHIGGALSMVDILAVLYGGVMQYDKANPLDPDRDRFILSKGHDCLGLYAALTVVGFITPEELSRNYLQDGGFLPTHPVKNLAKGIECSSGSLGMGLAFGIGEALAAKKQGRNSKVFVVVGDGECNEGSCWEAMMSAVQFKLDNLVMFVDRNGFQSDGATSEIMSLDLEMAIRAMGWNTYKVDGHDISAIYETLNTGLKVDGIPVAIIADTVKGKGVSFMENNNAWHHGHLNEEQYQLAIKELESWK